jgi:hypothetical protein
LLEDVCLYIENFSGTPYTDEENKTLMRFGKVFQQTYTRFLDLQKAEAQAREAKIEAALENVRSRSLAMHQSSEIREVVKRVFEKMKELGFFQNNSVMIVLPRNGFKDVLHWTFNENFETLEYNIPAFNHRVSTDPYEAWSRNEKTCEIKLNKEEKDDFLNQIFTYTDYSKVPEEFKKYLYTTEAYSSFEVFENHCGLLVDTFTSADYTEDQKDVVKRFAKVFDQAYTRFLDLQKAEAQAREAKIEAVLERIRSRTMAMQKSNELTDVAGLLFKQVTDIGIKTWTAGFNVWSDDNNSYVDYITSPNGGFIEPYIVYTDTAEALTDISNARKSGVEFDVQYVEGEKIKQLYLALTRLDEKQYEIMLQDGVRFPSHQYEHFCIWFKSEPDVHYL